MISVDEKSARSAKWCIDGVTGSVRLCTDPKGDAKKTKMNETGRRVNTCCDHRTITRGRVHRASTWRQHLPCMLCQRQWWRSSRQCQQYLSGASSSRLLCASTSGGERVPVVEYIAPHQHQT